MRINPKIFLIFNLDIDRKIISSVLSSCFSRLIVKHLPTEAGTQNAELLFIQ